MKAAKAEMASGREKRKAAANRSMPAYQWRRLKISASIMKIEAESVRKMAMAKNNQLKRKSQ
jgi:hypothetical protein